MTEGRKKEAIKELMILIGWTAAGTLLSLIAGTAWLIWRTKLALFLTAVQGGATDCHHHYLLAVGVDDQTGGKTGGQK